MACVFIEQLHWRDFLRRWDRPGMLFYLEPPHPGNQDDFGLGLFSRSNFEELATVLKKLRGRFKMSLNERPKGARDLQRLRDRGCAQSTDTVPKWIHALFDLIVLHGHGRRACQQYCLMHIGALTTGGILGHGYSPISRSNTITS